MRQFRTFLIAAATVAAFVPTTAAVAAPTPHPSAPVRHPGTSHGPSTRCLAGSVCIYSGPGYTQEETALRVSTLPANCSKAAVGPNETRSIFNHTESKIAVYGRRGTAHSGAMFIAKLGANKGIASLGAEAAVITSIARTGCANPGAHHGTTPGTVPGGGHHVSHPVPHPSHR